jgi:hypothetical protein
LPEITFEQYIMKQRHLLNFTEIDYILIAIIFILLILLIWKWIKCGNKTTSNNDAICMDYSSETMSELPADLICGMINNYRNPQGNINNETDSHSVRFNIEELKQFIYHMEKRAQLQDSSITSDRLGIRFYVARYPSQLPQEILEHPDVKPSYAGKKTLVLVPTRKDIVNGDEVHTDYNILDGQIYSQYFNSSNMSSTPFLAMNHGSLIPPADIEQEGFC